ncbi:MAG: ribonuclease R [Alphaproteobacteria bacterium]|nr:ribonuclease R [Alphaproteobacteria bacterium]
MARRPAPPPTREAVLRFINESTGRVGKREIARAFGLSGAQRVALRDLLRTLAEEGVIGRDGRQFSGRDRLPPTTIIEIADTDVDGELFARPIRWEGEEPPPRILVVPRRWSGPALGIGDRLLARLTRVSDALYEAQPMRHVGAAPDQVLGLYRVVRGEGRLVPTDRRTRTEIAVARSDSAGALNGELVLAEILPGTRLGLRQARIRERVGRGDEAAAHSLIAIHGHGVPVRFTTAALAEAAAAEPATLGARDDLRSLPLVTIDPADARDRDDAVWATSDPDPGNPGGWLVVIAIADVAHYVSPGSALDAAARERGNSTYFPDRVVPMLPEALSSGLCSLSAGEDRACLALRLVLSANGRRLRHRFVRGLMRSHGALQYEQVQAARDGRPDAACAPLVADVIAPLYGAFAAFWQARERRRPLDLELPERRVRFGPDGLVAAIDTPVRLDSHRLIEEFMIAANVCAAESLERRRIACMYRVHEPPVALKIGELREFLATLGLRLAKGQVLKAEHFNHILRRVAGTPVARLVHEVVLRAQSQALYSPSNAGHFGLQLRRYAHFTSPIRRYADVLVHRALIAAHSLGEGALPADAAQRFAEVGQHISATERRSMAAEREAIERYMAAFLADREGAEFTAHISGVTRFGLFVALETTGAEGIVPMRALGDDYYRHEAHRHALVGERSGRTYRLGDRVEVRLVEAAPLTGGLRFELLRDEGPESLGTPRRRRTAPPRRR